MGFLFLVTWGSFVASCSCASYCSYCRAISFFSLDSSMSVTAERLTMTALNELNSLKCDRISRLEEASLTRTTAPRERHEAFVRATNIGESIKNARVCRARGSTLSS